MRKYNFLDIEDNKNYYVLKIGDKSPMYGLLDAMNWLMEYQDDIPWWRGHSDITWDLSPSVYRKSYYDTNEGNLIRHFQLGAGMRYERCPEDRDYFSWLCLAQHYKLPTRLLDWSESLAIAIYFAVCENEKVDGAIWCLNPQKLNKIQTKRHTLYMPKTSIIEKLSQWALSPDPVNQKVLSKLGLRLDNRIIAVKPQHFDIRQLIQDSVFTIHDTKEPLNKIPDTKDFLVKIEINSKAKNLMEGKLRQFGMRKSYIFPDLEHLSEELQDMFKS